MSRKKIIKRKNALFLITLLLQSCGEKSSSDKKINLDFQDSTVESITQTNGAVSHLKKVIGYFLDTAYAGGGKVVCDSGEEISLNIKMVDNEEINLTTICDSDLELKIRRKLLISLNNHKLMRVLSGASTGSEYILDFSNDGFAFDKPFRVKEFTDTYPDNQSFYSCYLDYSFNLENGKVEMNSKEATRQVNIDTNTALKAAAIGTDFEGAIDNPETHPGSINPTIDERTNFGCSTVIATEVPLVDFRYKDGFIELDDSGYKKFSPSFCVKWSDEGEILDTHEDGSIGEDGLDCGEDNDFDSSYERWCIDDNQDGTCDVEE